MNESQRTTYWWERAMRAEAMLETIKRDVDKSDNNEREYPLVGEYIDDIRDILSKRRKKSS